MSQKKVYYLKVEVLGKAFSFESLFKNKKFQMLFNNDGKKIEMSHISVDTNYITGLFVTTQDTGIAPIHKPGDEDDYSAVPIPDGKGFAYPNVFIFIPSLKVFAFESNRMGLSEKGMIEYFNAVLEKNLYDNTVNMYPVLNSDAHNRINGLSEILKIDIQIAEPINLLKNSNKDGSFSDIHKVAKNLNSSKAITISLSADEKQSEKITKSKVIEMINEFTPIQWIKYGRTKNKLLVHGKK